ncbi:MAG: acetyl-CoA carboxylase biotin carboxyl carrier protein [Euryhalocaulis sp.]|uniref:acetyl-CoA carboxylase biotin carboxyl carrier protein n=1 Tax=Euryhalocaulis sp. TaxID=2744307 RepID=UPI001800A9DD|nr:acetyl-CoA carboxylase biotin carboxyl carrier protein [Euryhalocaulis sp.]MBA4800228.1 acetyl-CoA carboxylase biotin carboxyl carrier protein [Euryhalocaulis sp.]
MSSDDTAKKPIDPQIVRELAEILNETDLMEIEVRQDDLKLRLSRSSSVAAPVAAAPAPVAAPAPAPQAAAPQGGAEAAPAEPDFDNHPGAVKSPMVGTVYLRPSPDADAFVKEGDSVNEGDTILLIEAMKTFNPIAAAKSGKVTRLLVTDSQPVEFGEPLFTIE